MEFNFAILALFREIKFRETCELLPNREIKFREIQIFLRMFFLTLRKNFETHLNWLMMMFDELYDIQPRVLVSFVSKEKKIDQFPKKQRYSPFSLLTLT